MAFQIFKWNDGTAEESIGAHELALDAECHDLEPGVVHEVLESDLGKGAITNNNELASFFHGRSIRD